MESKKDKLVKTESRMVVTRRRGVGDWGDAVQSYKLPVIR